jgi:hypothetical protein
VLYSRIIKNCEGTKVRHFAVLALAGAVFGLLIPTRAQSFTYGGLVGGQVRATLAYGSGLSWCLVDKGNTEFQINQSNTKAVISFTDVIYFDGSTYYNLNGQTILTFNGATDGIIKFKQTPTYPGPVHTPTFTNFVQTYNASTDQIIISFSVIFPNCTLPIFAAYDAP